MKVERYVKDGSIGRPDVRESWQEAIGFLMRWTLLLVVGGLVAAWIAAGVIATKAVGRDLGAGMVLTDRLWNSDLPKRAQLTGYTTIKTSRMGPPMLMVLEAGFPPTRVPQSEYRFWPRLRSRAVDRHCLTVRGLPYGPYALQDTSATCLILPPKREVFLLDSRFVLSVLHNNPEIMHGILATLQGRGGVGIIHPGPLEDFTGDQAKLRPLGVDLPTYCSLENLQDTNQGMRTLGHAWRGLLRRIIVVTNNRELALSAAGDRRKRYLVHYIGNVTDSEEANLYCHATAAKFKEYLLNQPIPQ